MSGSSDQVFNDIRWTQIRTLLQVLQSTELAEQWYVERRFKDEAFGFTATLTFLRSIGCIRESKGHLASVIEMTQEGLLKQQVLWHLIDSKTPYREVLFRYLRRFDVEAGEAVCHDGAQERARWSACRNFLMELDLIRYNEEADLHLVNQSFLSVYAIARQQSRPTLGAFMRRRDEERRAIGDAAEQLVLAYERTRVGTDLAPRVRHVAAMNPTAGYDIISVTRIHDRLAPRYIEVKAVSTVSYEFYWTENEVNVARLLGSNYFLYLVPVIKHGEMNMDRLRMVCDAYATVLKTDAFVVEPNVRRCRWKRVEADEET